MRPRAVVRSTLCTDAARRGCNLATVAPANVPPVIEAYVDAVTASNQVPQDMPALVALGVMATAWVGKAQVLDPRSGHAESLSLYLFTVAASGERKSSTVRALSAPFSITKQNVNGSFCDRLRSIKRSGKDEAEYQRALSDRKQAPNQEKRSEAIDHAA